MKTLYTKTKNSFIASAQACSVPHSLKSLETPYLSPDKGKITTEYLTISNEASRNFLIITSGTAGPDLHIGSEVLSHFLSTLSVLPKSTGIVIVHGVNPWGAAWLRPTTINNVSLNYNFCSFSEDIGEIEEEDENLQKNLANYKLLEEFINPSTKPGEVSTVLKTLWKTFRTGYLPLMGALLTPQRFNHIGLGYGGTKEEPEVERTKETVVELLPHDYDKVIHIDIQTSTFHSGQTFVRTEDSESLAALKKISCIDVVPDKNKHVGSIITGLKDSESWESAALSLFTTGSYSRFKALRDENFFHHSNVWVENWSRGEQSSWPISNYIESRYKENLLRTYYRPDSVWQRECKESSTVLFHSLLSYLSK